MTRKGRTRKIGRTGKCIERSWKTRMRLTEIAHGNEFRNRNSKNTLRHYRAMLEGRPSEQVASNFNWFILINKRNILCLIIYG